VFEGLDRSGKSTQALKLLEHFEKTGQKAKIQRFPDRGEPISGPVIDNFLKRSKEVSESREAIHLLFSANRWLLAPKIRKTLDDGIHLIVDRYSFSGITYSLAKGLEKRWVCQPEVGLPKPDIVLFFDINPDNTGTRDGFGDEVMEKEEFQRLVYSHMKDNFDTRYWKSVNAAATIEEVHAEVIEKVTQLLNNFAHETSEKYFTMEDFGL